jgi:hypothetical protein
VLYDFEEALKAIFIPAALPGPIQRSRNMARAKYYSPRLDHSLIPPLYHAAKAQQVPMTALASRLVAEGLSRIAAENETCIVAEAPPTYDPTPAE